MLGRVNRIGKSVCLPITVPLTVIYVNDSLTIHREYIKLSIVKIPRIVKYACRGILLNWSIGHDSKRILGIKITAIAVIWTTAKRVELGWLSQRWDDRKRMLLWTKFYKNVWCL